MKFLLIKLFSLLIVSIKVIDSFEWEEDISSGELNYWYSVDDNARFVNYKDKTYLEIELDSHHEQVLYFNQSLTLKNINDVPIHVEVTYLGCNSVLELQWGSKRTVKSGSIPCLKHPTKLLFNSYYLFHNRLDLMLFVRKLNKTSDEFRILISNIIVHLNISEEEYRALNREYTSSTLINDITNNPKRTVTSVDKDIPVNSSGSKLTSFNWIYLLLILSIFQLLYIIYLKRSNLRYLLYHNFNYIYVVNDRNNYQDREENAANYHQIPIFY